MKKNDQEMILMDQVKLGQIHNNKYNTKLQIKIIIKKLCPAIGDMKRNNGKYPIKFI